MDFGISSIGVPHNLKVLEINVVHPANAGVAS